MKVTIKTLDSKSHEFDVEPTTTIRQLKHTISPQIEIESDKIRLIFKGKVLDDDKSVTECGIENAAVHAVQRLPQPPPPQPTAAHQNSGSSETTRPRRSSRTPNDPLNLNSSFLVGSLPATGNMQSVANILQSFVYSFQSSVAENTLTHDVASRITNCERFLRHIENEFNRSYMNNPTTLNTLSNVFGSMNPTSSGRTSENNDMSQFVALLRRTLDVFDFVRPMIVAYAYLIESAASGQANELLRSELYPTIADSSSDILHSFAHAFHSLSDVLFTILPERGDRPVVSSLSIARLGSDHAVTNVINRQQSQTTSSRASTFRQEQQRSSSNDNNRSSSNTPEQRDLNISDSLGGLSCQLTINLTSEIANQDNSPIPNVGLDESRNPTATANSSVNTPNLIRTTAGSSNSSSNSNNRAGSNNAGAQGGSNPNINDSVGRPRSGTFTTQMNMGDAETPVDNYLICRSIYATPAIETGVFQMPNIQTVRIPQSNSERNSNREQRNTTSPTSSTFSHIVRETSSSPPVVEVTHIHRAPATQPPTTAPTTENWASIFPPSTVPIIESDAKQQRQVRKRQPFSDAYIAGSPHKKKKSEEQLKAMNYVTRSLADNIIESSGNPTDGSVDVAGLRNAIRNDGDLNQSYRDTVLDRIKDSLSHCENIPEKYEKCRKHSKK